MQANDGDSDSEDISGTHEGAGLPPVNNNATVHELNQTKTEALRDIDKGGFSWFRLKMCFVSGTGFFADACDIFAINLASVMLECVYGHTPGPGLTHQLSSAQDFEIKVAAPVGYLFGRLLFGWLANIVGRKRMYEIEQMIIVTSTFAQVIPRSGPGVNIIAVLVVWMFIMGVGVGVGRDHPLSAVIASKLASTGSRGRLITTVFTAQSWGIFALSLIALVIFHAYKDSINELEDVYFYWRILTSLGCVARAIALYFRLTILETPRFAMDIDLDVQRAKADLENVLGPDGASAAAYWVIQRAEAPRRS